jgi:hypothetical protein
MCAPGLRRGCVATQHKLVVLDDDPTGTQTVHDVPVLTVWDVDTLRAALAQPGPCFYILTNSRTCRRTGGGVDQIRNLGGGRTGGFAAAVSRLPRRGKPPFRYGRQSQRLDLRGHPAETDVLTELDRSCNSDSPHFAGGRHNSLGIFYYG